MDPTALLCAEWQTLQRQQDQYERSALMIKIACLSVVALGLTSASASGLMGPIAALFWVQEGIFKTYQSRLTKRLLLVESLLRQPPADHQAMQLHTNWLAGRPSGLTLIGEYIKSALRPTVALPYLPLLVILMALKAG